MDWIKRWRGEGRRLKLAWRNVTRSCRRWRVAHDEAKRRDIGVRLDTMFSQGWTTLAAINDVLHELGQPPMHDLKDTPANRLVLRRLGLLALRYGMPERIVDGFVAGVMAQMNPPPLSPFLAMLKDMANGKPPVQMQLKEGVAKKRGQIVTTDDLANPQPPKAPPPENNQAAQRLKVAIAGKVLLIEGDNDRVIHALNSVRLLHCHIESFENLSVEATHNQCTQRFHATLDRVRGNRGPAVPITMEEAKQTFVASCRMAIELLDGVAVREGGQ